MLKFVFRKMVNKKWMVLCLLIGNILLISIAACNPMYTRAVLQRTLIKNMSTYLEENNRYPCTVTMRGSITKSSTKVNNLDSFMQAEEMAKTLADDIGLPQLYSICNYTVTNMGVTPDLTRSDLGDYFTLDISCLTDIENHVNFIAGHGFSQEPDEDGVYDVIVSQNTFVKKNLLLNEVLTLQKKSGYDGDLIRIRIVGVFENSDPEDIYWVRTPSSYSNQVFLPEAVFRELFIDYENQPASIDGLWYVLMDYTAMRGDDAQKYLDVRDAYDDALTTNHSFSFSDSFSETLNAYVVKANKVRTTLSVLQVPVYMLLAAFIFMVSRQMLDMEQNEISILKSRGAGKIQIINVYFVQSILIVLISIAIGLPLGSFLCQVLGSANSFLEFVKRQSLEVEFEKTVFLYTGAAAVFSVCAMVLPVFRYANVGIVQHKQKKNARHGDAPMWQKLFLDVILLGISIYGLYNYNQQKALLAEKVADGASLDPLLFLSSSLFIIGAALFALRVIPALVWIIFQLGKKLWSPALYASFLRILRTKRSQGFIMVFLMLTVALGIFNAQTARTINTNEEDQIRYNVGADIVLKEEWSNNADSVEEGEEVMYDEPDFGKYRDLEGAEGVARVMIQDNVIVNVTNGTIKDATVMAINTKEFGESAWMKDGLLPEHWYNYLNAISQNSRAVLLSANFRDKQGMKIGDAFTYRNKDGTSARGIVYGFIEYWPTYSATVNYKGTDGNYTEKDKYLIVAHLSQIQSYWGVKPYEVWIKSAGDSSQYVYDFIESEDLKLATFTDSEEEIVALKNDPIFQGTSGILTVSFIVVLLLCTVGFLIYWILSIQSRSLQFGIFRAMGMSVREIISMLINEQLFISGCSILTGAGIGLLASKLFIPLIQIAYASYEKSLPLTIVSDVTDYQRLFSVIGIVMLLCMVILGVLISRIKITQALKLGED